MVFHFLKQCRFFLLAFYISLFSWCYSLNIVLDLGNVLIKTDSLKAFSFIGHAPFLQYAKNNVLKLPRIKQYIQHRLYTFMRTVKPYDEHEVITKDELDNRLPQIMCDWFRGTYTSNEIRTLLLTQASAHPDYFKSAAEQTLIQALIKFMFTPEKLSQALYLENHAFKFVKKCKKEGHALYVLSNFDADSFDLIRQKYRLFFDLFDGIVVSGQAHTIKPCVTCYTYLFDTYALNPAECIFIDDRIENREKGAQMGMRCFFKQKRSTWMPWKKETDFDAIHDFIEQNV